MIIDGALLPRKFLWHSLFAADCGDLPVGFLAVSQPPRRHRASEVVVSRSPSFSASLVAALRSLCSHTGFSCSALTSFSCSLLIFPSASRLASQLVSFFGPDHCLCAAIFFGLLVLCWSYLCPFRFSLPARADFHILPLGCLQIQPVWGLMRFTEGLPVLWFPQNTHCWAKWIVPASQERN